MNKFIKIIIKRICTNDNKLMQMLGLCPILAITSNAINSLCMGLITTMILIITNVLISFFRKFINYEIRIPIYIIIIASVVSCIQILLHAYYFDLYNVLGIFIPLITTNCIILGRAESVASKQNIFISFLDGLSIGLHATFTILCLGIFREIIGNGTIFNNASQLLGCWADILSIKVFHTDTPILLAILPPGAFICLGLFLAIRNLISNLIKKFNNILE